VMAARFRLRASLLGLGAALIVVACTSITPTASEAPGSSAPSSAASEAPASATASEAAVTPAPGATEAPATQAPSEAPTTEVSMPPTEAPTTEVSMPPTDAPTDNAHPDWPAGAVAGKDAADHIGETTTVCGKVAGANWVFAEPGHPTWLNFGKAYPNQNFNALIWGEQRRAWPLAGKPEVVYLNKTICVTGMIQMYKTWPQIQDLTKNDIQVIP